MGFAVLPLHVWDRELDARILLTTLLLADGHQVLLGHEYNISPIYRKIPNIYHYSAGRPVYNEPRTNTWYEPIIANGGFNSLVFEEGINDILLNSSLSFPGINHRSVKSTSKIFAWCNKEIEQICSAAPIDLRDSLRKISVPSSNTRIELLGQLGTQYFSEYISAINTINNDYILISDNFGGLEVFGIGGQLKMPNQFKWVNNIEDRKKLDEFDSEYYNKTKLARDSFCHVINQVIKDNPSINFIFRPHPIADPLYWHTNLVAARNLSVICKDGPVPWIKASKAVIHAGCTLGLEAEIGGVPAVDIREVTDDPREASISTSVSTYKPKNLSELNLCIKECMKAPRLEISSSGSEFSVDFILSSNLNSLKSDVFDIFNNFNLGFPSVSNLSLIRTSYNMFFENLDSHLISPQYLSSLLQHHPPLKGKSRYYSINDISRRLQSAFKALSIDSKISIKKLSINNVFLFTPL